MIKDDKNLLSQLNKSVQSIFADFIYKIQSELFLDVKINGVYYSYKQGVDLNKQDNRNPIFSYHTFGLAIDMNVIKDNKTYLKSTILEEWLSTGVPDLAKELNIRWGGRFKTYYDPIHFDLGNRYDIGKLLELNVDQFGKDFNQIEFNKVDLSLYK